jgi:ABC-2 type transport system permease protein
MNANTLNFELKKLRKQNKSKLIFVLSIALVFVLLVMNNWMGEQMATSEYESVQFEIESINDAILRLPDMAETQKIREDYLNRKALLENRLTSLDARDWKADLENQIGLDQSFLQGLQNGNLTGGEPRESVEARLAMNEELLHRNIEPVHETYATQGVNFLRSLLNIFLGLGGIILIVFLTGDILAKELERGTIKLLFTQPMSRVSILNSKFIAATISSLLLLLIVGILAFLTGSLFSGIGSANYPILIHEGTGFSFSTIKNLLLQSGILFVMVVVMVMSLSLLMSIITSNPTLSISLTIILIGLISIGVTNYGYLSEVAHLIPFTYINTFDVINGSLASHLENTHINLRNGIAATLVFSVGTYIAAVILTKKKDIL